MCYAGAMTVKKSNWGWMRHVLTALSILIFVSAYHHTYIDRIINYRTVSKDYNLIILSDFGMHCHRLHGLGAGHLNNHQPFPVWNSGILQQRIMCEIN